MTCELCGGTGQVRWICEKGVVFPLAWDDERVVEEKDLLPDFKCPSCDGEGSY